MSRSIPANLGPLVLASGSPRRRQLMADAGYPFRVEPPDDGAECGVCSGESPAKFAMRMAWLKAQDVAARGTTRDASWVRYCCRVHRSGDR
ncbi:MAG: Maf family protein [Pirellulaceae bacterium]